MANRKITVLNPAGYQELFQSGDNLIVDGAVNLQSNGLTGVPTPSVNLDAANKSYVDAGDNANSSNITINTGAISALDTRLTAAEGDISTNAGNIPTVNDPTVTFTGGNGVTITNGSFTLNQSGDITIDIAVPSISGFLLAPTVDGDYIVTTSSGTTTYSETIDLGTY